MVIVFTGTYAWLRVVERAGELELSKRQPPGWEEAALTAGLDASDPESWVARVEAVAPWHSAIKPGDFACCQGVGSDVVFTREGGQWPLCE
jgi:hypothetical protein